MKIFKNILIALGVILIIAAIGIRFLPSHFQISNSIEINKPVSTVYAEVADFNKWAAWSPWQEMEPDAKATIDGTPGAIGHKMSWNGQKLGEGSMTISAVTPNEGVASDLIFLKPMKSEGKDFWKFEAMGDKTKVTWISSGDLSYPFGRLFGLGIEKMVGVPEKHGLDNLKKVCEAIVETAPIAADTTTAVKAN